MLIWLYRLLFVPAALLSAPFYLRRMWRRGGYGRQFGTRFGLGWKLPPKRPGTRRVWIQAVSLGEMLAIEPLVRRLAEDSRVELVLTATTSTGMAEARRRYGDLAAGVFYFPLDFWPVCRRVWRRVRADLAVCAETEIWPEHLRQAARFGARRVLVNGRLSDRSARRMGRLRRLVGPELRRCLDLVLASSPRDAERFAALGLEPWKVATTGNVKVDAPLGERLGAGERRRLREALGLGWGPVLLGSSTWPGEEEVLLRAFEALRAEDPQARLVLVPRHGERRGELRALLARRAQGRRVWFKSEGAPPGPVDILVGDTHGELRHLTQLADLAFIGKSLPPRTEGQTPIECAGLGVAMVFGPGMRNFPGVAEGLLQAGAARQVADAEEAVAALVDLARDGAARRRMGAAGAAWRAANLGALDRAVQALRRELFEEANPLSLSVEGGEGT